MPMPPRPINSRIWSWGKWLASSAGVGGVDEPDCAVAVLVAGAVLSTHCGQRPSDAPVVRGAPQLGQSRIVSLGVAGIRSGAIPIYLTSELSESIFRSRARFQFAVRAVEKKKCAELGDGQDVHPTIAVDIRRRDLDAHAGFVIDPVRDKSRASVPVPGEAEPVEHRRFVGFDVAVRTVRPQAFADDDVLQAVAAD